MSVSPAPRRGRRALSALTLLLLCLLAGAGCAARNRPATEPTTVPTPTVPLAPPTSTPTFTPTPTVSSPAPGLSTFKTVAAPDQTLLQSLARRGHRRGAGPFRRLAARCHAAVLPPEHPARALVGMYQ